MSSKRLASTWALIGNGFIAPRHREAIEAVGGEILAVVDPLTKADFKTVGDLLSSPVYENISHVAICTPNYLHKHHAQIFKGRVVICEKPLVISVQELDEIPAETNTVFQLRYHPLLEKMKEIKNPTWALMQVRVHRDGAYFAGWKGSQVHSGGILFNLGIHYLDILLQLFGETYTIVKCATSDKRAIAEIDFNGVKVVVDIEIMHDREGQNRSIRIDGQEFSLSTQDNLSFEGLHTKVYEEVMAGRGLKVSEARPSITLAQELYAKSRHM